MASEPTTAAGELGPALWTNNPKVREDRHVLVPDTMEWSGQRRIGDTWCSGPVAFITPTGCTLKLPCFDKPKGRTIGISTCTALGTPIMPFGDDAWQFLEVAEGAAETYLAKRWQISRVDFSRDVRIPDSVAYLREQARKAAASGLQVEVYISDRRLGFTYLGVAGGDRLRVYHKGLEAVAKFEWRDKRLADVVRVELQLRKGQLDERQRKDVATLRTARVEPEPTEDDIPTIGLKPASGHGIKRRHLWAMKRDRQPQRAVEATEAVDRFLVDQGLVELVLGGFGIELPDPMYGETKPHDAVRK
jgi:hypothetical protein